MTGKNIKYMAYPYGQFDYNTTTVLNKLNMRMAFCSLDGLSDSEENPFAVRRQFVYGGISLADYVELLD
jgi:peptidoglycan/xylan/chitin deacetylase (PgdA/CDA1 family)